MTSMTVVRMARTNPPTGEGEQREAAMRRRRSWVIGALFVSGLFTGFYVGYHEAGVLFHGTRFWTPTVSLVLAAIFLIAMLGGSALLSGSMDELERHRSYKAGSFAAAVYLLVYPLWFLLWKGGFVIEPVHWALFVTFWLSLAGGMLWYRFR